MTPKFRAWLPRRKKMVDVIKITFFKGEVSCVYYDCEFGGMEYCSCHEGATFNLMQSTGIKDLNGKEIYEGDVVFWQRGEIGDDIFTTDGKLIVNTEPHNLVVLEEADRLRILGNLYENPELVKSEVSPLPRLDLNLC